MVAEENLKSHRNPHTGLFDSFGTVSDNIKTCDELKQIINNHEDDQDGFVISELKKAYNRRRYDLMHSIEEKYPEYENY